MRTAIATALLIASMAACGPAPVTPEDAAPTPVEAMEDPGCGEEVVEGTLFEGCDDGSLGNLVRLPDSSPASIWRCTDEGWDYVDARCRWVDGRCFVGCGVDDGTN